MKETPVDQLQVCDFNPVAIRFLGLEGCKEMLQRILEPATDNRPLGINYWLENDLPKTSIPD